MPDLEGIKYQTWRGVRHGRWIRVIVAARAGWRATTWWRVGIR